MSDIEDYESEYDTEVESEWEDEPSTNEDVVDDDVSVPAVLTNVPRVRRFPPIFKGNRGLSTGPLWRGVLDRGRPLQRHSDWRILLCKLQFGRAGAPHTERLRNGPPVRYS